jgi:hypothetical protein
MSAKRIRKDLAAKKPRRPYSSDEELDESAELLEKETVDVEAAVPAVPNPNIERGEKEDMEPPAFEE